MPLVTPYSAEVVLSLVVGGVSLSLSHVGPNELIVRDECEQIPAGEARLYIRVDESRKVRTILLPHGIPGPHVPVIFL
jgi:hypothetical protein